MSISLLFCCDRVARRAEPSELRPSLITAEMKATQTRCSDRLLFIHRDPESRPDPGGAAASR